MNNKHFSLPQCVEFESRINLNVNTQIQNTLLDMFLKGKGTGKNSHILKLLFYYIGSTKKDDIETK